MTSQEIEAALRAIDEESLNIAPWSAEQLCKQAADLIAAQRDEIEAAIGHMLNANIELETGRNKRAAIAILDRGMIRARNALEKEGVG